MNDFTNSKSKNVDDAKKEIEKEDEDAADEAKAAKKKAKADKKEAENLFRAITSIDFQCMIVDMNVSSYDPKDYIFYFCQN